jgi:hypothetical protein
LNCKRIEVVERKEVNGEEEVYSWLKRNRERQEWISNGKKTTMEVLCKGSNPRDDTIITVTGL